MGLSARGRVSSDAITRPSELVLWDHEELVSDFIQILSKIICSHILIVTDGFIDYTHTHTHTHAHTDTKIILKIFSLSGFVIQCMFHKTKPRSKPDVMKFNRTINQTYSWKFFKVEGAFAFRYVTSGKRHLCLRNHATGSLTDSMHSLTSLPDGSEWQHQHQQKGSPVVRSATMVIMVVVAN